MEQNAVMVPEAKAPKEVAVLESKTSELIDRAEAFVVNSVEALALAGGELRAIKALEKEVDATFDPIVAAALASHREALAQKKRHRDPLEAAESVYKRKMGDFEEAERKRQAEEARKAAEEQERRDREAAEERERQAAELRAAGLESTAAALEAAPEPEELPVSAPAPEPPKVAGVAFRYTYSAEVSDLAALVKAVAEGKAPAAFLSANMAAINQTVRALKEEARFPGITVKKERSVSARA